MHVRVHVARMLTRTRCARFSLVSLPFAGAMSDAGGSMDLPGINLWGVCALAGNHLDLGSCANHVPCDCFAPGSAHVRLHPQGQEVGRCQSAVRGLLACSQGPD